MDFTYIIAGIIALAVGFVAGVVFAAFNGKSKARLIAIASLVSIGLDAALLISWDDTVQAPAALVVVDVLFFAIYSVIGCSVGALPALLAQFAWRKRPGQSVGASTCD